MYLYKEYYVEWVLVKAVNDDADAKKLNMFVVIDIIFLQKLIEI